MRLYKVVNTSTSIFLQCLQFKIILSKGIGLRGRNPRPIQRAPRGFVNRIKLHQRLQRRHRNEPNIPRQLKGLKLDIGGECREGFYKAKDDFMLSQVFNLHQLFRKGLGALIG